jgi:hypothetical protein
MAMYAVHAHIEHVRPKSHRSGRSSSTADVTWSEPEPVAIDRVELAGRSLGDRLDERLGRIGDAWSQSIFFIFDPDSWR